MRYALAFVFVVAATPVIGAAPSILTELGQPICEDVGELKEFVEAMSSGDEQWMGALKTCRMSKAGFRMIVLETDVPIEGAHSVAKVRVFAKDQSAIVYTILVKEQREAIGR